jgi:hypothetical protein
MLPAADIQEIRDNDPGAVLPGIAASVAFYGFGAALVMIRF